MIECSVVIHSDIVARSLNKERVVQLQLQCSICCMGNGLVGAEFRYVSAIIEVDLAFSPTEVVYFDKEKFFFAGTHLHFVDVALLIFHFDQFWLSFLLFAGEGPFLALLGLLLAQKFIDLELFLS